MRGIRTAKIVCHAVCPNSRLNARFEGVGCLHMPSRLEGWKLHVLNGLVGSDISACDIGFPIHTQEVTGSSPVAPTMIPNNFLNLWVCFMLQLRGILRVPPEIDSTAERISSTEKCP